ncbi:hypothetical protein [Craterilacuibacter sinensis]|uniref:Oxidoreductase n=1 Tax=Craterilacuibacter sinensis TaxID=2686017 RepID=A0A845BKG2_9NEIS|nr:hypothetical protein [Craterilacuibacter sinensis]MXR35880.1 hypothetical protein [Craterilacuibacter sinensis]
MSTLDTLMLANRIIVTPMCQYSADESEAEQALGRVIRAIRRYSAMPLGLQLAHADKTLFNEPPLRQG